MSLRKRHAPPSRAKARSATPPSRVVELTIAELGARGDGVARLLGEQVFVPFTVPGDRVVARIEGKRGDGLVASLVEVVEAGSARVTPGCVHFGRCGGCSLQHVDAVAYSAWKLGVLRTHLARQGLGAVAMGALVEVGAGARRRASFAFHRSKTVTHFGFNARASHTVIDVGECPLLAPPLQAAIGPLRGLLDQVVSAGEDGDVVVLVADSGLDVLIQAEARLDLFDRERLAAFAEAHDLARLSWRRPSAAFVDPIARRRPAWVSLGGIQVEPPPGGFLQPTTGGESAIAQAVLDGVGTATRVADLFSGCGSFTFPLAVGGRTVLAVEGDEAPIRALEAAAGRSGLKVTAQVRDLARRPLTAAELKGFDAVVFDPPRAGAQAQAEQLAAGGPPTVVAVSCNPATLARDLGILVKGGYAVERVTPIDQFAWSAHLEAVAVLRRA
jgi:23S rRNA (uracil1939-C5)-methyltransferase